MLFDNHVHTEFSADSEMTAEEALRFAAGRDLGLVFTEHYDCAYPEAIDFTFDPQDYKKPWKMVSPDGRLDLVFTPFFERVAKTNAVILKSEVHQMFGRYNGWVVSDEGEKMEVKDLIGWAEEHYAKW